MPRLRQRTVAVVDYDATWAVTFEALRAPILDTLGVIGLSVQHVGSTSVPGLAAKPISDIDVVAPSRSTLPTAIKKIAAAKYGRLKKQPADSFPTDIDSYLAGKTDFLLEALHAADLPGSVLEAIRDANQPK